ncbi:hypothetical protein [Desulfovibrio inopinatus]|uniref:hypothetical protein n=1 Tax=Desulfovibrio inopinatus TaxID=102109 RepID=UPI0003F72085|nr:hypothetical protein [Desulfovibrio inopinatus]
MSTPKISDDKARVARAIARLKIHEDWSTFEGWLRQSLDAAKEAVVWNDNPEIMRQNQGKARQLENILTKIEQAEDIARQA